MSWGPTGPGKLLTGSKNWNARVDGHALAVEVDGAPPVRVPLAAVRSVKVEHGIVWSDCTFEIVSKGAEQRVRVGGIANVTADGMKAAIDLAVKQSLGSIILMHAKALMDWRARAHQKLAFYPGTYVDSA